MIKFLDLGKVNNRYREEIDERIAKYLIMVGICKEKKMKYLLKI